MNQNWSIIINSFPCFLQIFLIFSCSFFVLGCHARHHIRFSCCVSLDSPWLWRFLTVFSSLVPMMVLRNPGPLSQLSPLSFVICFIVCVCVHVHTSAYMCVMSTYLLSGTLRCSRLILYIFCPRPRISQSLLQGGPGSFYWRMMLEIRILLLWCCCF